MHQVNRYGALLLLAIFLAGGVAAPQIHRIEDARERHVHEQAAGASGHAHSDLPGLSEAPQASVHLEVGCFLCSGVSVWKAQKHASILPGRLVWTLNDVQGTLSLPSVPLSHTVRGPPLV